MRITTLGTSHGDPTYCRFNASTLVETGGNSYLVDAGEPVCALMVRAGKDFHRLKAVFVTHMHLDHTSGLSRLVRMMIKYPAEGKHADVYFPEAAAIPCFETWLRAQHVEWPHPTVTLKVIRPGVFFSDGVLEVTAEKTQHLDPSFAFVFEAEGKRVVFTGDLRGDFSDFPRAAREEPCDLCLCETTHYQYESALPVLKASPIRRLVHTHIADKWHGEGEAELWKLVKALPYPVDIAYDGDEFEV